MYEYSSVFLLQRPALLRLITRLSSPHFGRNPEKCNKSCFFFLKKELKTKLFHHRSGIAGIDGSTEVKSILNLFLEGVRMSVGPMVGPYGRTVVVVVDTLE